MDPEIAKGRFGDAVRAIRTEKGVSQERLAQLCGLHRTYVGGIERGERNPTLVNIRRIAEALDLSAADMMTRAAL